MAPKRNAIRMRVFLHVLDWDCFCRASSFFKMNPETSLRWIMGGGGAVSRYLHIYIYVCVYTHIKMHIYIHIFMCIFI